MPELPEVEVARRSLHAWLDGKTLTRVETTPSRVVRSRGLSKSLVGARITAVERRGKWLRIPFSDGRALFSHLGMTGKWVRRSPVEPAQPYERARLDAGKTSARYLDPRMFGRLELFAKGRAPKAFEELGPDPLVDGIDDLPAALAKTGRPVKVALLDQTVLAGIGNIQAAEGLWRAKIDPRRAANGLSTVEARRLGRGLMATLKYTLAVEDSPEITYVEEAGADNPFKVYGRAGEPCPRCKTPITRFMQAGRATFACLYCVAT